MIRQAVPRSTCANLEGSTPGRDSPVTRREMGGCVSRSEARTAYPSIAELSHGGRVALSQHRVDQNAAQGLKEGRGLRRQGRGRLQDVLDGNEGVQPVSRACLEVGGHCGSHCCGSKNLEPEGESQREHVRGDPLAFSHITEAQSSLSEPVGDPNLVKHGGRIAPKMEAVRDQVPKATTK